METEKKKPGRVPQYTPEQREERRKARVKLARVNATPEQKAAKAKAAREWRAKNPEKVEAWRVKTYEKRVKRIAEDPEYKEKLNTYQREYKAAKVAEETED